MNRIDDDDDHDGGNDDCLITSDICDKFPINVFKNSRLPKGLDSSKHVANFRNNTALFKNMFRQNLLSKTCFSKCCVISKNRNSKLGGIINKSR